MSECWVITDGAAGNERQALALAERLGLPVRSLVLQARPPWSWLAPRLTLGGRLAASAATRRHFVPPWPALAIGCGRAAALFTRMLGPLSDGHCRSVQILDPRVDPRHWDLLVAPRHDGLRGDNVLSPLGSLNPVDDAWLEAGREACPTLEDLPRPRLGLLLGGPRRGIALDEGWIDALIAGLRVRFAREGGSLLLLASRRTPAGLVERVAAAFDGRPGLIWRGEVDGPNPYPGVLGWADRLLVSPDSVNMLSEACAVGCAVHTWADHALPGRLAQFHDALRERHLLHDLDADTAAAQPPLRETEAIARQVRARLLAAPRRD